MKQFTQKEIEEETKRRNDAISERNLKTNEADKIRWKENEDRYQRSRDDEMMSNFYKIISK